MFVSPIGDGMVKSRRLAFIGALFLAVSACGFDVLRRESRSIRVQRLVSSLAADSMAGRAVGTIGSAMAVRVIAAEFDDAGVTPARTLGYVQGIAAARVAMAVGPGMLWATGYERSTVGAILSSGGVPVVADPYPGENFFFRSDNVRFAYQGIPAYTLFSFNLHTDYHRPSDDVEGVDVEHLVTAFETVIMTVRALADAPSPPARNEGGQLERIARWGEARL